MDQPIWHPSPNFGPRRGRVLPDMVVLHFTAMSPAKAALDRLCDPAAEVSAHYLIGEDGRIWHMVAEEARAWHAGAGSWGGVTDVNSRSIGIELDNPGGCHFAEPLMCALETLLSRIVTRWSIPPERVIGHADMAPGRKFDPGPFFNWQRLAHKGLSIWPDVADTHAETPFENSALRFGYPSDCDPGDLLRAFRDRFRAGAHGPQDATDRALMAALADRWPVAPATRSA